MNRTFALSAAFASVLAWPPAARPETVVYPGPPGIEASPHYAVEVLQDGTARQSFVYISHDQFPRVNLLSETTSWTTFSFSGKITVVVRKLNGGIGSCRVLPSRLRIEPRANGSAVEFDLERPAKVSVEFDGDNTHPLLIFADALEAPPPEPGPNALIYPPGTHEIGRVMLESGQTVYIAGGAYVKGCFEGGTDKQDIVIRGRGVLSGENFEPESHHMIQIMGNDTRGIAIEGITIVNAPWTNIRLWGSHNSVRNVKMIGWRYKTDGVLAGDDSLIEDCFFKVNDDAIKLYHSRMRVRDCVIWQLMNGAPFQISWNVPRRTQDVDVRHCDVIRTEHYNDWHNRAIFNCMHGGTGHLSDYLFEDIRIENSHFRFLKLIFIKTKYNEEQIGFGEISNIRFRNIEILGEMEMKSVIQGHDAQHGIHDLTFENVRIGGRWMTNLDDFEIDSNSTRNIRVIRSAD
ncbi:MAG: Dextranase precursor [candidate division BRC1 bacterium ADurb.BinA364]|nr:MAG: Dextranase precursor [candidate division BRC1 bacterium ADurb.BinA364]